MERDTYADPEVLVSTEWVAEHLNDPKVKVLEVDEDVLLYEQGHVPGAQKLDWHTELQRQDVRDFIGEREFAELMERKGISNDDTVVLYGDKSNWWAAYAFWFLKYNGHADARLMNGGRQKWVEEGRELETEARPVERGSYRVPYRDASIRAFAHDVMKHLLEVNAGRGALVDVRSPEEFSGEKLHMPEYPQEGALRGGHIPGAANIPWARAVNPDGTFKSASELAELYRDAGVLPEHDVVAYCRIAERSSHSWFVLKYLLGYPRVRNYDGSWTEWGNMVGVPVKQGAEP
ncbi:MAG: sulfurtransferase [Deinococcales bacterium]|nr:sulfurtransferase [Deinococcales bacterium]